MLSPSPDKVLVRLKSGEPKLWTITAGISFPIPQISTPHSRYLYHPKNQAKFPSPKSQNLQRIASRHRTGAIHWAPLPLHKLRSPGSGASSTAARTGTSLPLLILQHRRKIDY